MPRRKFIDKKNATHFQLVHRAQNDPLIHDENAPSMVFAEVDKPRRPTEDDYAYSSAGSADSSYRSRKTKERGDLEEEFGLAVRKNEGEAAEHGVFFDDTQYDYMQHMRDLGSGEGAVTWVEAKPAAREKGKGKQRLEDALRKMDLDDGRSVGQSSMTSSVARSLLPEEVLPSEFVTKRSYQDQQDVPDEIAGFQPDMDPRLREVLEALDDEEYVDDEEDIFGELTQDGYEIERDEWERLGEQELFGNEDDGWESDDTIKAPASPREMPLQLGLPEGEEAAPPEDPHAVPTADPTGGDWLDEFKKFKKAEKNDKTERSGIPAAPSMLRSSAALSSLAAGRKKKRKGAKTSTTNYSMTSSSLARTDPLTTLDDRFDKMEAAYSLAEFPEEEEDEYNADAGSLASGMTGLSRASKTSKYSAMSGMSRASGMSTYSRADDEEAPKLVRSDFDGIMDDFLGSYSTSGKHKQRVKRGGPMTGMAQLDEIRQGLGPARFTSRAKSSAK
ncbi:uncharacterized protein MYCFIDRAFT_215488 [Pseudocercospora fijiensis CIRAD86]|uniref:Low temperature viability protein n=1 Tax=Pseudocercospora fijiensis (strain CIRAD86) TaxID=383855 RepID=M3AWG6_PSEFD|nr:uncharacterized protein MYCFIDRAFT_215488 [Pseudocercospora fijiensis CIRAD86]EME81807.1 hypothetical protein MYCFIDRAFT_215488 [Pseudocercospora fijiensis CIRAD86]